MDTGKYNEYIDILKERLSDYRLFHSLKVAESSYHLSKKYGGDLDKAVTAGLLHDILKDSDKSFIFSYLEEHDIKLTPLEKSQQKLWHAIAGAEYIKNELNIKDPDILSAVRYHTTGKANMALLEKIIFTADFISADRDYEGVDEMREKAKISLDGAMLTGLSFTIKELVDKKQPVHPDSLDAYNDLILNLRS